MPSEYAYSEVQYTSLRAPVMTDEQVERTRVRKRPSIDLGGAAENALALRRHVETL